QLRSSERVRSRFRNSHAAVISVNSSRPVSVIKPNRRQLPPLSESSGFFDNAVDNAVESHAMETSTINRRPIRSASKWRKLLTFCLQNHNIRDVLSRRMMIFGVISK